MPIDPRQMDIATEFCRVAGKGDLLEYLGVPANSSADDVQEALKRKRKYMQGMQANPKYKNEALQFIKNYAIFQTLLSEPAEYAKSIANVQERKNLPVLEMTIKSALKGGELSPEQIEYMRRNATQLGIGEDTFIGTLKRLSEESETRLPSVKGHSMPPPPPPGAPGSASTTRSVTPQEGTLHQVKTLDRDPQGGTSQHKTLDTDAPDDPYAVLGARREMPLADVRELYHDRLRRARTLPTGQAEAVVAKLEAAWVKVADQATPADLSRRSTGPPARDREGGSESSNVSALAAPTAPPVRQRSTSPMRKGESEFTPVGEPSGQPIGRRATIPNMVPGVPQHAMRSPSMPPIPGPAAPDNAGEVEVRGAATRQVAVDDRPLTLPLFVLMHTKPAPSARVISKTPWLTAQPKVLEAGHDDHEITVRIDPALISGTSATGVITITTERGASADVTFEVEKKGANARVGLYVVAGLLALTIAIMLVYLIVTLALA